LASYKILNGYYMSNNGWVGVDLDGTIAKYTTWQGTSHIGEPIEKMVNLVKEWISHGVTVKIFTARVCDNNPETVRVIKEWCIKHIGYDLEVTNIKDYGMIALYDDRAFHVIPNTGVIVQWNPTSTEQLAQE
jgi:hypothetical protein